MKTLTIKLSRYPSNDRNDKPVWKVIQVTDSLLHHVGDYISEQQVEFLCEHENWKVTFVAWSQA